MYIIKSIQQTRKRWIRSKKAIYNFLDIDDKNNQINSTYDLTLIARQDKTDKYDAA